MRCLDFQKILVPVDFSDESFAAVDTALELVESPTQVIVIHILPILTDFEAGLALLPETDAERLKLALTELRKRLHSRKYTGIDIRAVIGDPAQRIVTTAKDEDATLIVMPSHGRTGFRHFMMGSVAEQVLRLANCPVLILKHVRKNTETDASVTASETAGATNETRGPCKCHSCSDSDAAEAAAMR